MAKIELEDLIKVLSNDVITHQSCIEMNFCIENNTEYEDCWIGKMPDRYNSIKEIYWYGLVRDGSQAYDYHNLEDILNAKVFNGKSMCDVIEKVTWYSLDGCIIDERLPYYIEGYKQDFELLKPLGLRIQIIPDQSWLKITFMLLSKKN